MIRLFLAIILALDAALFTALLFLLLWQVRQRAIRARAIDVALKLPEGVVIVTARDGMIAMNDEAKKLLGTAASIRHKRLEDVLPLVDETGKRLPAAALPIQKALRSRRSLTQKKYWLETGKERRVPITLAAAFIPIVHDEPVVALLIRDISREELMETMKRDFIGIASHQMRSPLASLKWYGEMLTHDAREGLDAKRREYLDRMNDATARMISLVDDFLDASKFETYAAPAHMDAISLKELMAHIIDVHHPLIETKKLSVRVSQRGAEKPVYADPAMLREVLANFVANAVKYNRKGGKVLVEIRFEKDAVEIKVKDTGVGIPKDQQDRVFTKFFRADNAVAQGYKGTGLGLYTAKLILEQMKGDVRFESQQDKGTTFWARFPRDQRPRHH